MIRTPDRIKRYSSAKYRFFKPVVVNFFAREFPKLFGPLMRERLAEELIDLFDKLCPEKTTIRPGQMLWNALDKNTAVIPLTEDISLWSCPSLLKTMWINS